MKNLIPLVAALVNGAIVFRLMAYRQPSKQPVTIHNTGKYKALIQERNQAFKDTLTKI